MYQCLTEYIDSKIFRVKQEVQRTIRQEFQNLAQTLTPPANKVMSTVGGEEANGNRATNRDGQLYELDVVKCEVERLCSLTIPEQALSFVYPPTAVVMDHSTYLFDVSSLSKVARWQLYAEARNSFIIPPVDDTARMRLALDLVLSNYNKAKENTIDAAKKLVTKIN
ncbi:hypothetical protein HN873_040392 [Arachis hypogaea]